MNSTFDELRKCVLKMKVHVHNGRTAYFDAVPSSYENPNRLQSIIRAYRKIYYRRFEWISLEVVICGYFQCESEERGYNFTMGKS